MRAFIASHSKRNGMDKGEINQWWRLGIEVSLYLYIFIVVVLSSQICCDLAVFGLIQGIMMLAWERRRNEVAVLIPCF